MGLQFDSSPYLQIWQQQQAQRQPPPDLNQTVTQPLLQGLQMMADNRRQQQLMDITKQKNAFDQAKDRQQMTLDQQKADSEYGTPIEPGAMFAQPTNNAARSSFMPAGQGQVAQGSSIIDAFKAFKAGGMKAADARPEFMDALGKDERKQYYENANPKPFDPDLAAATAEEKRARAEYLRRPQSTNQGFTQENQLRSQFLNQSKDFSDTASAYQRMVDSSRDPSPAGDLALIYNYNKMLDPGSTVRESEFANAAASGSMGDKMQAAAQRLLSGQRLDENMRADFMGRATDLYGGQLARHKQRESEYQRMAKSYGGDPSRVTPELATPMGGYQQPAATGAPPTGGPALPTVANEQQYAALPSGAEYMGADGKKRRKK